MSTASTNPLTNPLALKAVTSIFRAGLQAVAGYLVTSGIWSADEAESYVVALSAGLALFAATVAWSVWEKYGARLKLVTALIAPPGTTEQEIEVKIASGEPVPAASTPKTVVPVAAPAPPA